MGLTFGVIGTGISIYVFRIIRSLKSKKCHCIPQRRKTILITGATSGLGKACAYEFAKRNCKLILGCRNLLLGQRLVDDLNKHRSVATLIPLDLFELDSIKQFCDRLGNEKIDVIINNAGVMAGHFRMVQSTKTEEDMTVNYLGPLYLTLLLLTNLVSNEKTDVHNEDDGLKGDLPRIIFVSSSLCKRGELDANSLDFSRKPYNPMQAYANSKLALCLFARNLHMRLNPDLNETNKINVITMFTDGMVNTALGRHIISNYSIVLQPIIRLILWILLKDPFDVCHAMVHYALSDELNNSSDKLFSNFTSIPWPNRIEESMDISSDLWIKSCNIVGLKEQDVNKMIEKCT